MSSILVTTGATVTFRQLLDYFTDHSFIKDLTRLGVNKIVVQYGNEIKNGEQISSQIFHSLLKQKELIRKLNLKIEAESSPEQYTSTNLTYTAIPFSLNIDQYISQSDIVISHAGTGSIVDVLRSNKKLVVVVNKTLMDNHQEEVADAFTKLEYCVRADSQESLLSQIEGLLSGQVSLKTFPKQKNSIVQSIIYQEVNTSSR